MIKRHSVVFQASIYISTMSVSLVVLVVIFHTATDLVRLDLFTQEEVRSTIWERVEIEDEYKGLVIGKRRAILREISGQTGANLTIRDGEIYIIRGNEEQRKLAKVRIGTIVVSKYYNRASDRVREKN